MSEVKIDKTQINVHDHGLVRLITWNPPRLATGCSPLEDPALSTVNSARVSFDKESSVMAEKDWRLVDYLQRNYHTSPSRHSFVTFELRCPLFVAAQVHKHQVGVSINQMSRRYVQEEPVFYLPSRFKQKPNGSIKQGAGGFVSDNVNNHWIVKCRKTQSHLKQIYQEMIGDGIAPEEARIMLPEATYTRLYISMSFQALCHFLNQRLDHHSQSQIRDYAEAIYELTVQVYGKQLKDALKTGNLETIREQKELYKSFNNLTEDNKKQLMDIMARMKTEQKNEVV